MGTPGAVVAVVSKIGWTTLAIAKFPAIIKGVAIGAAIYTGAALAGAPIHDIWFDWILFFIISAVIGGAPEPDSGLTGFSFWYTWFYRSGHLLVASATAYFLHQKKWSTIRDGPRTDDTNLQ